MGSNIGNLLSSGLVGAVYNKQKKDIKSAKNSAASAQTSAAESSNVAAAERAKRLKNLQYGDTTSGLGGNSGVATTPFRTLLGK